MKLRPLGNHLIVTREDEPAKTKSGLVIPDTAKEKSQRGTVIAVGDGKILKSGKKIPLDVMEGDRVLFGKYAGEDFKLGSEEYVILTEDDILAIIK